MRVPYTHLAIYLGFLIRLSVAFWNGFYGPSFQADGDALLFHLDAVEISKNPTFNEFRIGWIYSDFLGFIYSFTSDSLFLGSFLSCLSWLASAFILKNLTKPLSVSNKSTFLLLMIYSLLPSSILITSVTLRESYQILFVNLTILSALKIYLYRSNFYFFWLIIGCVGMGVLHPTLIAFGVLSAVGTIYLLSLRNRRGYSLLRILFTFVLIVIVLILGSVIFTSVSFSFDEGFSAAVSTYQQNLFQTDARTTYTSYLEFDGMLGLLLFLPKAIFQYFTEPLPWNATLVSDWLLILENTLRILLVWRAWSNLRIKQAQELRLISFIFLCYIFLEATWALGTANWGTAVRHHLPGFGLLLVAAFAFTTSTKSIGTPFRSINSRVHA